MSDANRSKYLYRKVVKGKPYLYFRMPTTSELIRLPLDEDSAEFRGCYDACMKALLSPPPAPPPPPSVPRDMTRVTFIGGTIGAAVTKYRSSPEYKNIKESTRRKYETTIKQMLPRIGDLAFAEFDLDAVDRYSEQLVDAYSSSVARNHVWMIANLFRVCRKHEEFGLKNRANPTDGAAQRYAVKNPRHAWKPQAQELFYQTAPIHLQDAYTLLRYCGQRGGDATKLMLSDYDGEFLHVIPEKQGTERGEAELVPVVKPLRELLERLIGERGIDAPILLNAKGKPWASTQDLSEAIRNHLIKIGLAEVGTVTISLHGLRSNAASEVAELMLGTKAIKAVTLHRSDKLPEYYARAAEKRVISRRVRESWDALIEEKAAASVNARRTTLRRVK